MGGGFKKNLIWSPSLSPGKCPGWSNWGSLIGKIRGCLFMVWWFFLGGGVNLVLYKIQFYFRMWVWCVPTPQAGREVACPFPVFPPLPGQKKKCTICFVIGEDRGEETMITPHPPNHQRWYAKWKLCRNTYTLHTRLAPTCMLSQ